ncbi:outer membrane protein assembly factor BamB family protein [Stratiformator vulcanicus]|uniref:Outer membrane biogenesis protein BamB n=1 Tax=Stratiformator vulcanicus TaxID=2527980 RepID=A0A517R3M0_9PLAN|nr:PQQ-binding-like beta-propeller repeat protein [Stratiformator vulcanicus]QDT38447.1 outer membrane biogenesis protein BamB [Stratiformator vulcanicus]
MSLRLILPSALIALLATTALAADGLPDGAGDNWHRWRGPNGDGTAAEGATPPIRWSETENVKWKTKIPGSSYATPIVWEDRIYMLTAVDTGRKPSRPVKPVSGYQSAAMPTTLFDFKVLALDRNSGEIIGETVCTTQVPHEPGHKSTAYVASSAITDGEHVYAFFGSRGLYCLDTRGEIVWKKDFGKQETRAAFGEGATPALYGDTIVVPWDHEGPDFIAALDAKTGEEKWRVNRDEQTTWVTPLIVPPSNYKSGDRVQVIMNASNRTRSYDLATGEEIWECGGQASNPIATPVTDGENVYCMTGYRGYAVVAIPLDSKGDITGSEQIAWSETYSAPYVSSPVLYEGTLYFPKSRDAILTVLNARTGVPIVRQMRLPGLDTTYASLAAANGHIYIPGRNGTTLVLKHGDRPQIVAENNLPGGIDASPVIVGKQLFLKAGADLYCFED